MHQKLLEQTTFVTLDETASLEQIVDKLVFDCKDLHILSHTNLGNESLYKMVSNLLSSISYHFSLLLKKLLPSFLQIKNYTETHLKDLQKAHKAIKRANASNTITINFIDLKDYLIPVQKGLQTTISDAVSITQSNISLFDKEYITILKKLLKLSKNISNNTKVSIVKIKELKYDTSDLEIKLKNNLNQIIDPTKQIDRRKLKDLYSNLEDVISTTETLLSIENPITDTKTRILERHLTLLSDVLKEVVTKKNQNTLEIDNEVLDNLSFLVENTAKLSTSVSIWCQVYQHLIGTSLTTESLFIHKK